MAEADKSEGISSSSAGTPSDELDFQMALSRRRDDVFAPILAAPPSSPMCAQCWRTECPNAGAFITNLKFTTLAMEITR